MIQKTLLTASLTLCAGSLLGQSSTEEESKSLFNGSLYSRASLSYQHASDYHSGYDSFASAVYENSDGEFTLINYSLDLIYITPGGLYVGSGLYASSAEVKTNGLGLGVPNTDSDIELREIPFVVGYNTNYDAVRLRFEARYLKNVDDDFEDGSVADATLLPVTDGSDSLTLSVKAKADAFGYDHALQLGYEIFENDVSHPIFPSFSLGDRYIIDYEIGKAIGDLRLSLGHLISISEQTDGTPSGITGTAYLTEKPRYNELRFGAIYRAGPRLVLDAGLKYIYEGKDAPKQQTAYLGAAYIF